MNRLFEKWNIQTLYKNKSDWHPKLLVNAETGWIQAISESQYIHWLIIIDCIVYPLIYCCKKVYIVFSCSISSCSSPRSERNLYKHCIYTRLYVSQTQPRPRTAVYNGDRCSYKAGCWWSVMSCLITALDPRHIPPVAFTLRHWEVISKEIMQWGHFWSSV